jgi:hypothetical protein
VCGGLDSLIFISGFHKDRYTKTRHKIGMAEPTFHILIASAGRPTLKRLLDSLRDELKQNDAITVVFDGPGAKSKSGYDEAWFKGHISHHTVLEQFPNLGAGIGGEPIRTKYQTKLSPKTTFIMHADDDDIYLADAFDILRRKCADPEVLYITKMDHFYDPALKIPRQNNTITFRDIGTPNGVIPFASAGKVNWGMRYGGDFDYYNALQHKVKGVKFLPDVIYRVYKKH